MIEDQHRINFETKEELIDFILDIEGFEGVWVATGGNYDDEIIITEDLTTIISGIQYLLKLKDYLYLELYGNYEDAYNIALSLREGNPLMKNHYRWN